MNLKAHVRLLLRLTFGTISLLPIHLQNSAGTRVTWFPLLASGVSRPVLGLIQWVPEPFPRGELSGEWTWLLPLFSAAVKNGRTCTSTFTSCCWGACLRTETVFSVISNIIATLEVNWSYRAVCQSLAAIVEDKNAWSFPCCPAVRPHGGVLTNRDVSGLACICCCDLGFKATVSGVQISSHTSMNFVRWLGVALVLSRFTPL